MGNEHNRHPQPLLQISQQVENLRLNGDIKRGCRLIGDENIRLISKRHGNHHALALTT